MDGKRRKRQTLRTAAVGYQVVAQIRSAWLAGGKSDTRRTSRYRHRS
jgi:hypothetical protein